MFYLTLGGAVVSSLRRREDMTPGGTEIKEKNISHLSKFRKGQKMKVSQRES